jgi:hypothetical protein
VEGNEELERGIRTRLITAMLHLKWFIFMLRDVAVYGWTNRSFGLAAMILVLIGIGLIIGAAAVSAPWIYTIF